MTNNQKITLNIVANLFSFAITIIISLFITPVIVNTLGSEAYGFVGLANNFVSYATLITIALNAMASRFVSIEIYRDDYEEANRYFTSVFFANIFIALVMAPVLAVIVWKLEFIIEIPNALVTDVKVAFGVTFFQFVINIILSRYEIATFVTNRLYLSQKNTLIASAIRLLLILVSFSWFSIKISYLVTATFAGNLFCYIMNVVYTRRFLPNLKIKKSDFDFSYIKRLLSSGIWSLINKLSSLLLDGMDLLLSNLFIGPVEMGALAVSKTVPAMFYSLRGTLDYPFTPPMTQCYAEGDIDGVIRNARMGNKVLGIFIIAPIATFTIYGADFFKLWVPTQDSVLLQTLAILSLINLLASSCINSVFTVFTVTNNVRLPALIVLVTGIISIVLNFILLNMTSLGVYVIAGTGSILSLIRNLLFTPIYGAHCLGVKKRTFYHEIITGWVCLVINLLLGIVIHSCVIGCTWISLIGGAGLMVIVCVPINCFIVLSESERGKFFSAIVRKLGRK